MASIGSIVVIVQGLSLSYNCVFCTESKRMMPVVDIFRDKALDYATTSTWIGPNKKNSGGIASCHCFSGILVDE